MHIHRSAQVKPISAGDSSGVWRQADGDSSCVWVSWWEPFVSTQQARKTMELEDSWNFQGPNLEVLP